MDSIPNFLNLGKKYKTYFFILTSNKFQTFGLRHTAHGATQSKNFLKKFLYTKPAYIFSDN